MLIACPECAAIQTMPAPQQGGTLRCWQCDIVLERSRGRSVNRGLACSLATFLLLFPSNIFVALTIIGPAKLSASTHLFSGVYTMWGQGFPLLAITCALLAVILPFFRFGLLSIVLIAIRRGAKGAWIGRAFRYANILDMWAMPDVLLLGAAFGYGRVVNFVPVLIGSGGYCFLAAAFMAMITRASLDRRAVWRLIKAPPGQAAPGAIGCTSCDLVLPAATEGGRCPRCAARVYRRKPHALMWGMALVLAGYILLPVANYYPMSTLYEVGNTFPHTIFGGIKALYQNGFMPLAIVLSFTSLFVPFAKLIVMTWLFFSIGTHSDKTLRRKTKIYRLVDELGRWSNLDPFAIFIYAPMVPFGALAHVQIGGGSPAFLAVVVISMFAAHAFDPRLVWDAARRPHQDVGEAITELIQPVLTEKSLIAQSVHASGH